MVSICLRALSLSFSLASALSLSLSLFDLVLVPFCEYCTLQTTISCSQLLLPGFGAFALYLTHFHTQNLSLSLSLFLFI
uniref:Putative secreted protein n=1 Tax=Anopheles darlingi TaxID=43151 RepID=A0A2M4D2Q3_ANODA